MATYQPRDRFYRKARKQGLPSRAAFKLGELLDRYPLVRPGGRVLDLGCAPGGWLKILAGAVGKRGRVVGVDLVPCRAPGPVVTSMVGDLRDASTRAAAMAALGGLADLITCDMAPRLSGIGARDEARCRELLEAALEIAREALRPGAALLAKIFMGRDFHQAVASAERYFTSVEAVRTRASRPGSAELYLVARDFHPPHP